MKTGESISRARQTGASEENLESYFDYLSKHFMIMICSIGLVIFNVNETGVPLDPKPLKVYGTVSQKNFYSVSSGTKSQLTVLTCVSAGGQCLPPMIIYNKRGRSWRQHGSWNYSWHSICLHPERMDGHRTL